MRCQSCNIAIINGVRCHEHGCPDAWRDHTIECFECGCEFQPSERHQRVCNGCAGEQSDPFAGSFMQPEIYKGAAWLVDTDDGTVIVPDDVVSLSPFDGDEDSPAFSVWQQEAIEKLSQYCEGEIIEVPTHPRPGWLGRLSAPGYLDCTEWSLHESEEAAMGSLIRWYGDEG